MLNSLYCKSTAPTGVPQSLEAVAVSSSSILITWNPPVEEEQNGIIRMYYINVTELPTGNVRELMAHGDERIKVVNNLHPYYVYECAVAAYTIGLGPAALTQVLTDPAGIHSCSKSTCLKNNVTQSFLCAVPTEVPQNVVAVAVNATHVIISWDPPPPEHQNGLIGLYHISITEADTNTQLVHTSVQLSTLVGPIHPYYTYKFSVAAETVEIGPYTSQLSLKMPQAGKTNTKSSLLLTVKQLCFLYRAIWSANQCVSGCGVS